MGRLDPSQDDQGNRSRAPPLGRGPLGWAWLAIALTLTAPVLSRAGDPNKVGSLAGYLGIRGGLLDAEQARVGEASQLIPGRGCMAPPTAIRGGGGEQATVWGRVKALMVSGIGGMSVMMGGCFGGQVSATEAEMQSAWKSFAAGREGSRRMNESSWRHSVRSGTPRSYRLPPSLSLEEGLEQIRSSPQPDEPGGKYVYNVHGVPLGRGVVDRQASTPPAPLHPASTPRATSAPAPTPPHSNGAAYEVMLECLPSGVPARWVRVLLHQKHCRTRTEPVQQGIEETWNQINSAQGLKLFDGKLFRFGSCQRWLDKDGSQEVQLELGVTRFKSFMGTNMAQGWERMAPEHLSSPLGCNVLVHTSDSCIMLIRRNDQVMTEQQCYSLPGGYPSPDKARLYQSMTQVPLPTSEGQKIECVLGYSLWPGCTFWNPKPRAANESGGSSGHEPRPYSDIVSELFDCPLREACDDLGLNRDSFPDTPLLLGITRSLRNQRPNAVFYLRTTLSSKEVSERYQSCHSAESDEVLAIRDKDALPVNNLTMPSCSRGALYLFSHWLQRRTLSKNQMGSRDGFAEGGVTPLEGGGVGRAASPSAASMSYMWVGGGGGAGTDKEEQARGRTNPHDSSRPWWGGGGQGRGFGGEASVPGGGAQALAWREVSGSSQGAWRGMERSRSESTHLDRMRSRSVDSDKLVDEAGLEEDAVHGVRQAEEGGVRMMRRIQSDAHIRAPALESQQEKDSKLTRAVYWWMSTSQDPENIRKALFDLELEDKEENDLTDDQLLAVMQRRLEIVEESSTSSDSSTLSESDDETPRQKERRLQKEAEAARRKKRKKAYKKKEKQRKEDKKEKESRKK